LNVNLNINNENQDHKIDIGGGVVLMGRGRVKEGD
jgi:hypothetical protein